MTFEELAKVVADDFMETMRENDLESFDDMVRFYWWTPQEVKAEVDYTIRKADESAYIDEWDGKDVFLNGGMISYRKFSAMWHGIIRRTF